MLTDAELDVAETAFAAARGPLGDGLTADAWLGEHQDAFGTRWGDGMGDGMQALARQRAAGRAAARR